jgi:hypothetical protein
MFSLARQWTPWPNKNWSTSKVKLMVYCYIEAGVNGTEVAERFDHSGIDPRGDGFVTKMRREIAP